MKKLIILLLLPCLAHSQIAITTLGNFVVGGSSSGGGGTGVAIDTSYEVLAYAPIMNVSYDPLRPNKQVTSTGSLSFFMNYVPDGFNGNVRFIYTTAPVVNGIVTTPFPTGPATVTKTYTKATGVPITWTP